LHGWRRVLFRILFDDAGLVGAADRVSARIAAALAADWLVEVTIDKERRGEDRTSDHVPIRIELG